MQTDSNFVLIVKFWASAGDKITITSTSHVNLLFHAQSFSALRNSKLVVGCVCWGVVSYIGLCCGIVIEAHDKAKTIKATRRRIGQVQKMLVVSDSWSPKF